MACQHLSSISDQDFRMPEHSSMVLNDECSQCFQTPESIGGLYICTKCWNGGCQVHAANHSRVTSHSYAIHLIKKALPGKTDPKELRPAKVTKLAIGGENGFPLPEAVQYETSTQLACMQCPQASKISTGQFKSIIDAILDHKSLTNQSAVEAWEEQRTPCEHTQNLQQLEVHTLSQKSLAHCDSCDLKDNLWLCMTCGSLGCARSVFGGGGGNNHGVEHNQATGHNVVCKLGTITPEGTADIYCYACDEMRIDENLIAHLQCLGIATNDMQKTSKTMAEMELEQNLNHEWNKVIEKDEAMKLLYGPGYTGLKNLGNSCYLASTVQVLFSLPSFCQRYYSLGEEHLKSCRSWRPWDCYQCQMAKLATGLLSGSWSKCPPKDVDELLTQPGISPSMFKRLISSQHPEFRTFRQQDAMQFFQYLLQEIRKQERSDPNLDPSSAFSFMLEQRLRCSSCQRVRYTNINTSDISLEIPAGETEETISFQRCLELFKETKTAEFKCPHCQTTTTAEISHRLLTFPDVLIVQMQRFNYTDWVPKKMQTKVSVPMTNISFEDLRGHGQAPDEISLPDTESHNFAPSEELLQQLLTMGFSTIACVRALKAVNNSDVNSAADWMFAHLDDPELNEPIAEPSTSSTAFDTEGLSMLSSMGFDEERCKKALSETNGDVQRAADWLMSHAEEPEIMPGSQVPAVYNLTGMITHLGSSIHFGHYVAHVYNAQDKRWVYFNDNKVSESISPPIDMAYIYCFQRQANAIAALASVNFLKQNNSQIAPQGTDRSGITMAFSRSGPILTIGDFQQFQVLEGQTWYSSIQWTQTSFCFSITVTSSTSNKSHLTMFVSKSDHIAPQWTCQGVGRVRLLILPNDARAGLGRYHIAICSSQTTFVQILAEAVAGSGKTPRPVRGVLARVKQRIELLRLDELAQVQLKQRVQQIRTQRRRRRWQFVNTKPMVIPRLGPLTTTPTPGLFADRALAATPREPCQIVTFAHRKPNSASNKPRSARTTPTWAGPGRSAPPLTPRRSGQAEVVPLTMKERQFEAMLKSQHPRRVTTDRYHLDMKNRFDFSSYAVINEIPIIPINCT